MENIGKETLSFAEKREITALSQDLERKMESLFDGEERERLMRRLREGMRRSRLSHDTHGLCTPVMTLRTANAFADMVDPDRNILTAILLLPLMEDGNADMEEIKRNWGEDIASLMEGIANVSKFSHRNSAHNQENFRGLMLALAHDIRVIIIMIVRNLVLMRAINLHPDEEWVKNVAFEANCLYAQLAHRLGLYKIKGELEDLSLKYTNSDI